MARAFLFVLDSFGIGGAPDASRFGDDGADTFGHIEAECAAGRADVASVRAGPLNVPNMRGLGLAHAAALANGRPLPDGPVSGFFGAANVDRHHLVKRLHEIPFRNSRQDEGQASEWRRATISATRPSTAGR